MTLLHIIGESGALREMSCMDTEETEKLSNGGNHKQEVNETTNENWYHVELPLKEVKPSYKYEYNNEIMR